MQELHELSDELAIERIRSVPGLGRWSAQIYLMFSLGRPDIWPEGDVGAMRGLQKLKGFEEKLTSAQAGALVEPLAPHRSAVALLAWKYANSTAL